VDDGLLSVQPGVGKVVSHTKPATAQEKQELLVSDIEQLILDARTLSLDLDELIPAIQKTWRRLVKE